MCYLHRAKRSQDAAAVALSKGEVAIAREWEEIAGHWTELALTKLFAGRDAESTSNREVPVSPAGAPP